MGSVLPARRVMLALVVVAMVAGIAGTSAPASYAAAPLPGPFLTATLQTGYERRVQADIVSHYEHPSPANSGCSAHRGYLNYATAALWLRQSVADANAKLAAVRIANVIGQVCDPSIDPSRSNLWLSNLMRPYFLYDSNSRFFPNRLTTAAQNNLVAQMWAYASKYSKLNEAADPWSIYDSENHDAQAESFYALAAQVFNGRADYASRTYADGSTVAQQYQAWHTHWSNYLDTRAKQGLFVEVASPIYQNYTLHAILNIYDFAADPVVRKKARMVLDLDFADYAQQELHGVWGGAKSRSYPTDSPNGANDAMTSFAALLFGPDAAALPKYDLPLATSGYFPPLVVQSLALDPAGRGSFAYVSRRPGVGHPGWDTNKDWHVSTTQSILNYTYVTPDYVLGTAELNAANTDIAPSSQNRWQGIIFAKGTGDRVFPQAAPSSVSATMDAFNSVQHTNVLITRKNKYTTEPTLVYFPPTLDALAEQGGWVFVKDGAAYLAVRPVTGGYHWLTTGKNKAADVTKRFIQLGTSPSPIIFEAARANQYTSFGAFETRILHNTISYFGGRLDYTSGSGTRVTYFLDGTAPQVNGAPINYSPAAVYNSPHMQSVWNSGKITVTNGAHAASYDFSNTTDPIWVAH
jgi:hypothetical protein